MTTLTWKCLLQPRPDLIERLNTAPSNRSDTGLLARRLANALAMGGGASSARDVALDAINGVNFRLVSTDGECRLQAKHSDETEWGLIVDLVAAASTPEFQLRRCFNDATWFSPGLRSARSKFCSQRCRNRFNYEMREQEAKFVCVECNKVRDVDSFSGLGLEEESVEPADVHAAEPLCVECIVTFHPEWFTYVSTAELIAPAHSALASANGDYVSELHRLIREALERGSQPQSLKRIAKYVTDRMAVRGQRQDLTILGHILRFPAHYKQISKHVFVLREPSEPAERNEAAAVKAEA